MNIRKMIKAQNNIIPVLDTKICILCHIEKPLSDFPKRKDSKDGYRNNCKECERERKKKWQDENSEEIFKRRKKYTEEHKEQKKEYDKNRYEEKKEEILAKRKEYYENNKEKTLAKNKEYRKEYLNTEHGREKIKSYDRKRRELVRKLDSDIDFYDVSMNAKKLFDNKCANCGSTDRLELDHFYPLSKGFGLDYNNAILLCKKCNCSKGAKAPEDFFDENTFIKIKNILGGH